jgi:hypothetical protein
VDIQDHVVLRHCGVDVNWHVEHCYDSLHINAFPNNRVRQQELQELPTKAIQLREKKLATTLHGLEESWLKAENQFRNAATVLAYQVGIKRGAARRKGGPKLSIPWQDIDKLLWIRQRYIESLVLLKELTTLGQRRSVSRKKRSLNTRSSSVNFVKGVLTEGLNRLHYLEYAVRVPSSRRDIYSDQLFEEISDELGKAGKERTRDDIVDIVLARHPEITKPNAKSCLRSYDNWLSERDKSLQKTTIKRKRTDT